MLKAAYIQTPKGEMIAVASPENLHLLEFVKRKEFDAQMSRLLAHFKISDVTAGEYPPTHMIQTELAHYFSGKLTHFKTPIKPIGTPFQQRVWKTLQTIPFGKTVSYAEQARLLGQKSAVRAVASANAKNPLAIIIPCHRVIRSDASLGGYAAGIHLKSWLIEHEKQYKL